MKKLKIFIEEDVYYPEEEVRGEVALRIDKTINLRSIKLEIK